jgi:hypothetical protein
MVKKFALFSTLGVSSFGVITSGVLGISSAFALSPAVYQDTEVVMYGLKSIGIETPLTASGAQLAPEHAISGDVVINSVKCRGEKPCVGLPAPFPLTVTFAQSVIDKNLTSQRSFGACRRAIETAGPGTTIVLRGDFYGVGPGPMRPGIPRVDPFLPRVEPFLKFVKLTSCEVERPRFEKHG